MTQRKYYSPRLTRSLISPLYHAAKAQRVPMTALASRLVAEGLERLGLADETGSTVAEEPADTIRRTGHIKRINIINPSQRKSPASMPGSLRFHHPSKGDQHHGHCS